MKKDEVVIGRTYLTKASGKLAPVRIDEAQPKGAWIGTDRTTNDRVQIKSAKELRREIMDDEMAWEGEIAESPARNEESVMAVTRTESDIPATEAAKSTEPEIATSGQPATPAPERTPAEPSYDQRLMFAGATDPPPHARPWQIPPSRAARRTTWRPRT